MSGSDVKDPNDPARTSPPATATGLFNAMGSARPAADDATDDFFAQFRAAPSAAAAPPAAPAPTMKAPPTVTLDQKSLLRELQQPQPLDGRPAPPAVPRLQEIFIKPSAAKRRAAGRSTFEPSPGSASPPAPSAASAALIQGLGANVGAFTAAFQTLDAASATPPVKAAALSAAPVSTPVSPVSAPAAEPAAEPVAELAAGLAAGPSATPGSFTQMFHAESPEPKLMPEVPAPPPETASSAPRGTGGIEATADPAKPTLTQILRRITDEQPVIRANAPVPAAPDPVRVAPAAPVKNPTIAEILERLDGPPQPVAANTPGAPGSFTQFMAGTPAAPAAPPGPPASATPRAAGASGSFAQRSAPAPEQGPEAGAFTQMMASLGPPAASPAPQAGATTPPSATPARGTRPGSVTELLQSFDSPVAKAEVTKTPAEPGGFTQFFQSPLASKSHEPHPAPSDSPAADQTPGAATAGGGFTQLMQALNEPSRGAAPAASATGGWMPRPAAEPLKPVSNDPGLASQAGSFTQLMRTLDGPEPGGAGPAGTGPAGAGPARAESAARAVPLPYTAPQQAGLDGSATSIFSTPAPRPPASPQASGPGEFTRILRSSSARDAVAKAPPAAEPRPAPLVPPAMQMPPMAMPVIPPAPQMPMPGFAMPQMPVPQAPAVPVAPAPPAKTTLQQYLPLILIGNALILVVIIVIVFFALHAHK